MKPIKLMAFATVAMAMPHLASAATSTTTSTTRTVTTHHAVRTMADPTVNADADMKEVLAALKSLGGKPIETLDPTEARKQPTPADAVKKVMKERGMDPSAVKDAMNVDTQDISWMGPHGDEAARVYRSKAAPSGKLPVVVYFHGGGWVIADIDTYDSSPRAIAQKTGALVISFEYKKAPEYKFPAQHEDAFAAYQWTIKNASKLGGDPDRIAVMGESAGGNMAENVAIMARDKGIQMPVSTVLVYPVAGADMHTPSYIENANAKPLNKAMMKWFVNQVTTDPVQARDPRIDLVHADLRNLPPVTVITAGIDPLRSEGRQLANNMQQAGDRVDYENFPGVTHEFFGMGGVVREADKAQDLAAQNLRDAFGVKRGMPRVSSSSTSTPDRDESRYND